MAFSFENIVNRIKQLFKPKTFFNVETGEIIKSKEYKKLNDEEKKLYIKETTLPRKQVSAPTVEQSKYKPTKAEDIKHSRVKDTEEITVSAGRIYKPKLKERKKRGKDKEKRKQSSKEIKRTKEEPKKETKKKSEEPKKKTYKDVKPPEPPKKIKEQLKVALEQTPVDVYNIKSLKAELSQLQRYAYPWMDLTNDRNFLISIVEDLELYYEGTDTYENYIQENKEKISELITAIQYYDSDDPTQITNNIIELASTLNMGVLSLMQQDTLDDIRDKWGWNTNG